MKTIPRTLATICKNDLKSFPIVTITGPRQAGKTTLLKTILPDWQYVSLEDPSAMDFASEDPKGFLKKYDRQSIIDEIQRVPSLLSEIQVSIDKDRQPGRYAITGSHNLLLLQQVSQSLAGRTAIRNLLPLSFHELFLGKIAPEQVEEAMFYGGYPLVHAYPDASHTWLDSYAQTYVERDVRLIRNVSDLSTFRRFLKLCAARTGQLLDLSSLGGDVGLSHNTVRDWVNVLEAGFVAFRLEPYFKNYSKRITKSPKLYFYDTGLLCRLLDIRTPKDLVNHAMRGAIFENWCVLEAMKAYVHKGERPEIYYWRDQKFEVDLLMSLSPTTLAAFECKSGVTFASEFLNSPRKLKSFINDVTVKAGVIYGGDENQERSDGEVLGWQSFGKDINGWF